MQASKAQMLAIMMVIVMGLVAFTVMSSLADNMNASLEEYYASQAFADFHLEFSWTGAEVIQEVERVPGVAQAEGRAVVETRAPLAEDHEPVIRLVGAEDGTGINIPYLVRGRMPEQAREIALLPPFAEANDIRVGDTMPIVLSGRAVDFHVVGLAKSPEYTYVIRDIRNIMPDDRGFGIGFVRRQDLQEWVGGHGRINSATMLIEPGADPDSVKEDLEERLSGRGLRSVVTRDDQLSHQMVRLELDGIEQIAQVIPVAFLGISAVVIFMMLSRMIQEDRGSIGVLKAVGYTNREILMHYLKHALVLGAGGAIVGLSLGQVLSGPFSAVFVEFFHIPQLHTGVDPQYHLVGLVLTSVFCGITGLVAARGVLAIVPAEALRPPAPAPGSKNVVEIVAPRFWMAIPFTWRTVFRHIFRDKRRFFLGVTGVALSFCVIVLPLYAYSVMMMIFIEQYDRLDLYDFTVSFDEPMSYRSAIEETRDVRYRAVEPFIEYPVNVQHGWREEGLVARGLPHDAQLQRFEDAHGNTLTIPKKGILITKYTADALGIRPGTVVELTSPMLPDRSIEVPVRGVVVQYLGSGVYMSVEQMASLTQGGAYYNGLLLASGDDASGILAGRQGITSVLAVQDLIDGFMVYIDLIIMALGFYVLVGGVLGFAILFNTVSTSVTERRREIASLRVLGYSKIEVFGLLLRENVLATILGVILGIPAGYALIAMMVEYFSSELFALPMVLRLEAVAISAALSTLFAALTMLAVRTRVWRMGFLEALTTRMT